MNWNEIFYYDESSPTCLKWKHTRHNPRFNNITALKDTDAGCLRFYRSGLPKNSAVNVDNKSYYSHRVVYELMTGETIPEDYMVDHIDGNPHNNKISNLKLASALSNSHNVKKMSHNTSGITGVTFSQATNVWRAIWHDGKGKQKSKSFSVSKHGETLAKELAIAARELAISKLKEVGHLYTDRHGK